MNAHAKPADIVMDANHMRCIPQGYGYADELVAIRTLMRLDRNKEALERFERWLDRNLRGWRAFP